MCDGGDPIESSPVEVSPGVEAVTVMGQRHEVARDRVGSFQLEAIDHRAEDLRVQLTLEVIQCH